ncbi:serine protease, partial [Streptomyces sp. ZEA17I]
MTMPLPLSSHRRLTAGAALLAALAGVLAPATTATAAPAPTAP